MFVMDAWTGWHIIQLALTAVRIMQAHAQDSSLTVAKLGLAQIDLLKGETTNAITLLEGTLQEVTGWLDALKVLHSSATSQGHFLVDCNDCSVCTQQSGLFYFLRACDCICGISSIGLIW